MPLDIFYSIVVFVFGAMFGSFANVCIYRMPRNQSIVFPPSHCPFCKSRIAFYNNIPLFSYLILTARCRECGVFIPFRYFAVELLTAVSALLLYTTYGFGLLLIVYFIFVLGLIISSFIDLEHRIIPNLITFPGIAIGLTMSYVLSHSSIPWPVNFTGALIGIAVGSGSLLVVGYFYTLITGREGIGLGDVKLLAVFGAFFGWQGAFFAIFLGSILGLIASIPIIIAKKSGLKYPIPFGPFLSLGLIIYVWFAKSIFDVFMP